VCDSGASTATSLSIQRGNKQPEKRVVPFIKGDPDNVASTLEWRRRVMHSQEATQASNSRQRQTAENIEIEGIRRRCREREIMLEREIKMHEERYAEWLIEELEGEEKDEKKDHSAASPGWWDPQSDYQRTECGD
jgi:glycine/D-amino acid oxidase-like deaminating enzyme